MIHKGYSIEPAFTVYPGLIRKLTLIGMDPEFQWFFSDGAFIPDNFIHSNTNSWTDEEFVVIADNEIIAFFSSKWVRPLDIINSLRIILFDKSKADSVQ